jgi:hypothetical protein
MTFKQSPFRFAAGVVFLLLSSLPGNFVRITPVANAEEPSHCSAVGGALMTNIDVIAGVTNMGPVSGDLAGSIAATILGFNSSDGTYTVQHYWVTAGAETIVLDKAILHPTYPTSDTKIVAVPWGNYRSNIIGGTGKFKGASGYIDYFGMADFNQNTLVLRYRGVVCYAH